MDGVNRQLLLVARPEGIIDASTTTLVEGAIPELADGEALVRVRCLSIDPTIRMWMGPVPTYLPPIGLGEVVRSVGAGEVVATRSDRYAVGDLVAGLTGWQDYCVIDEGHRAMAPVPEGIELEVAMSVLGVTGMTAWVGLLEIGRMAPGDVVAVSGAAGATGSMVGQIAQLRGASRVVGIAGGPEKCQLLIDRYGYDAAIDYRSGGVSAALAAACPEGVDVFFDNVGGRILEAGLANLSRGARVVICGAIGDYNATEAPTGPRNYLQLLVQRATMQGFVVLDHLASWGQARREISEWLRAGQIAHDEQVLEGLEQAPVGLNMLFTGANTGKVLVSLP